MPANTTTTSGARSTSRISREMRLSRLVQPGNPAFATSARGARSAPRRAGQVDASSGARRSKVVDPPSQTIRETPGCFGTGRSRTFVARWPRALKWTTFPAAPAGAAGPPRDDEVRVRAIGPSDLLDELRVRLNPRLGPGPGLRAQRNAAPALKGEE